MFLKKDKSRILSDEVVSNPEELPGVIGFVLNETVINQPVVDEIAKTLCQGGKRYMRVAFIGTNREIKKFLKQALDREADFVVGFFDDMEVAKVWLLS